MVTRVRNLKLFIRTDANTEIGYGHVMRCLALAQAWQDVGGQADFVMAEGAASLRDRLHSEGMNVVQLPTQPGSKDDANRTAALARRREAVLLVVDGYHFGGSYQKQIKDTGLRLLFIDDYGHADFYYADFILNQNIYAHEEIYPDRDSDSKLLLGTRYALLRREFLKWQNWGREIPDVARKVLVTLGGGDPDNATLKVIQALQQAQIDGLEIVVVVGGSNPHKDILADVAQRSSASIDLKSNVMDMPALMAWADVAVSAGGSTSWELAFMGLPTLILYFAENQRPIADGLDQADVAINLGEYSSVPVKELQESIIELIKDPIKRSDMVQKGRVLVEGDGSTRVVEAISND
jgi:UDP-2,4-diacetamido-2,4,6-trideoxy-beta-L-altropyranose hydrolase